MLTSRRKTRRPAAAHFCARLELLEMRSLLATVSIVNPFGPISAITLGGDGSFQVYRPEFAGGQVFPNTHAPADAGIFLRHPDGTVVGLDTAGRVANNYRTSAGATGSRGLNPLSLTLSDDGLRAILIADNRYDGNASGQYFQLAQVTSYRPGDDYFRVDNTIVNLGMGTLVLDVFAAADLYLANSDLGVGYYDPATGAIGGSDLSGNYRIFVQPNPAGGLAPTGYQSGHFQGIWRAIGQGNHLTNDVRLPTGPPPWNHNDLSYTDNGAALEWQGVSIAPGESARISYFWSFGGSQIVLPDPPPQMASTSIKANAGELFDGPIAMFLSPDPTIPAGDFLATVHWGDGSFLELATVRPRLGTIGFEVVGTHTYAAAGTYNVAVTVVTPGGASANVVSTAEVSGDPPTAPGQGATIAGNLAPSSDTGISNFDRITNDNQPLWVGTATPNTTWKLTAIELETSASIMLGSISADDSGAWQLASPTILPDGRYRIEANRVDAPPGTPASILIDAAHPVVIDTAGPRLIGLGVLPRAGRLVLAIRDDGSGVAGGTVPNLAAYTLTDRIRGRIKRLSLRLAGVTASASGSELARVILETNNRRLPPSRNYLFQIGTLISDVAGNLIAGRFIGRFPTGDTRGTPSTFLANLQTNPQKLLAVKPISGNAK